jgi:hypothetical protein
MIEKPNNKYQMTNKYQISMYKSPSSRSMTTFLHWFLLVITRFIRVIQFCIRVLDPANKSQDDTINLSLLDKTQDKSWVYLKNLNIIFPLCLRALVVKKSALIRPIRIIRVPMRAAV